MPTLTDEDRATMAAVDAHTDHLMARAFAVLDEPARLALADGVRAMADAAP